MQQQPEEVPGNLDQHPPLELPSGEVELDLWTLRTMLAQKEAEMLYLKKNQTLTSLTPELLHRSNISNYFQYCTGFSYDQFNNLPLTYKRVDREINQMPLRHPLLLVLMRLRKNLDLTDLAYRFQIPE